MMDPRGWIPLILLGVVWWGFCCGWVAHTLFG